MEDKETGITKLKNDTVWQLKAISEPLGDLVLPIDPILTVGRGKDNDVVLGSKQVSRQHAVLNVADNALTITDLGSSNGTSVNQEKLTANEAKTLANGDTVSFATFDFQVDASVIGEPTDDATITEQPLEAADEDKSVVKELAPAALATAAAIKTADDVDLAENAKEINNIVEEQAVDNEVNNDEIIDKGVVSETATDIKTENSSTIEIAPVRNDTIDGNVAEDSQIDDKQIDSKSEETITQPVENPEQPAIDKAVNEEAVNEEAEVVTEESPAKVEIEETETIEDKETSKDDIESSVTTVESDKHEPSTVAKSEDVAVTTEQSPVVPESIEENTKVQDDIEPDYPDHSVKTEEVDVDDKKELEAELEAELEEPIPYGDPNQNSGHIVKETADHAVVEGGLEENNHVNTGANPTLETSKTADKANSREHFEDLAKEADPDVLKAKEAATGQLSATNNVHAADDKDYPQPHHATAPVTQNSGGQGSMGWLIWLLLIAAVIGIALWLFNS